MSGGCIQPNVLDICPHCAVPSILCALGKDEVCVVRQRSALVPVLSSFLSSRQYEK